MQKNRVKLFLTLGLLLCLITVSGCSKHTHTYEWIIDENPTYNTNGKKHQECTICKEKQEYVTVEKLSQKSTIKENVDVFGYSEKLTNLLDIVELKNLNKTGKQYTREYCIPVISKNSFTKVYNNELGYTCDLNEEILVPEIQSSFSFYDENLGPNENKDDGIVISMSFLCKLCGTTKEISNIRYEFYKYENSKNIFTDLVLMYSDTELIGKIYFSTTLTISDEWITNFINNNLVKIKITIG